MPRLSLNFYRENQQEGQGHKRGTSHSVREEERTSYLAQHVRAKSNTKPNKVNTQDDTQGVPFKWILCFNRA